MSTVYLVLDGSAVSFIERDERPDGDFVHEISSADRLAFNQTGKRRLADLIVAALKAPRRRHDRPDGYPLPSGEDMGIADI